MTYRERLWPPLLWWVVGLVIGMTFVIAVAAILPFEMAIAAFAVTFGLIVGVLLGTAPVVGVSGAEVVAAGASLPLSYVGRVAVLEREQVRRRMGVDADPRAYLTYRAFCDGAVEVEVVDAADPHPYWLVSSRNPAALAAAIESARTTVGGR